MINNRGFMEIAREERAEDPVEKRIVRWSEFRHTLSPQKAIEQAERCMECGTPFCAQACPVHNLAPEFNDDVRRGDWKQAWLCLASTNNFPEFTSRVCPALCEGSCSLGFAKDSSVTIQAIENAIVERAWKEGWVVPLIPREKSGKKVAVVGSGPSGLACAQQLARAGHDVTVYEKNERPGGLLRFGIPDFKLSKSVLDRRLEQMKAEGVKFVVSTAVGSDRFSPGVGSKAKKKIAASDLINAYDAVVLCGGSEVPRDLDVPGRKLQGVHFALELLQACNREVSGEGKSKISVKDQDVIVIGGGDTGADVVGTAHRQGARSVMQVEINPEPPEKADRFAVWPDWPRILRTSAFHEEGCERRWCFGTKEFLGDKKGHLRAVKAVQLEWSHDAVTGRRVFKEKPGTEVEIPVQAAFLAMGFVHPSAEVLDAFGVEKDLRGNARAAAAGASAYQTNVPKVFVAGDMRRGQSLVVRAIAEGRHAAKAVDKYLMGESFLED
ncbi:glutamate synthase subunit beta [Mesosutterella sp. AGMB02718]|uniref:Glutamate synthase subunit beta n=1 Tax=Mesosutterella faecium TaxID=2925194 RepID=A0ABT7ILA4_9BURK|nr:glutamate synthase subunit beta [Mesosutterella sp. AGMB02718]MDL2058696.1 glutamate synthase subunit beta [Mesosutterella sp. AGMB02718]